MELKTPAALLQIKERKPTGPEYVEIGEFLLKFAKIYPFKHFEVAQRYGLSKSQALCFRRAGKWSKRNKQLIRDHAGAFGFTEVNNLARQRWPRQGPLENAIWRVIEQKPQRKRFRRSKGGEALERSYALEEDRLRDKYQTKVEVTPAGVLFHSFGVEDALQGLLEKLMVERP